MRKRVIEVLKAEIGQLERPCGDKTIIDRRRRRLNEKKNASAGRYIIWTHSLRPTWRMSAFLRATQFIKIVCRHVLQRRWVNDDGCRVYRFRVRGQIPLRLWFGYRLSNRSIKLVRHVTHGIPEPTDMCTTIPRTRSVTWWCLVLVSSWGAPPSIHQSL